MSLKGAAQETLKVQDQGHYIAPSGCTVDISQELQSAVAGTRLYRSDELGALLDQPAVDAPGSVPPCEVTDEKTQEAARRLVQEEGVADLVLLNFASARNVGGGFLTGAKAQEEDLTRCSGLYRCLETHPTKSQTNLQAFQKRIR